MSKRDKSLKKRKEGNKSICLKRGMKEEHLGEEKRITIYHFSEVKKKRNIIRKRRERNLILEGEKKEEESSFLLQRIIRESCVFLEEDIEKE